MTAAVVHVIVTCANRKSRAIPAEYQLGSVTGASPRARARQWIGRLAAADPERLVPAVDLYAGEHWSVARGYPGLSQPGETIRLWACSAGYGLVPAQARLVPYHATWTAGQYDSVPGSAPAWWADLAAWEGPDPSQPRTVAALAAADPAAVLLLVLSKNYLGACAGDLAAAARRDSDPGRIIVVSAGGRSADGLAPLMVPADARLQARFGGTRRALNARIAGHLLAAGVRHVGEAAEMMAKLLAEQPPIIRYDRVRQSDDEILSRIAARLASNPALSANRLLREFRDAGLACEQHRFVQLFRTLAGARP